MIDAEQLQQRQDAWTSEWHGRDENTTSTGGLLECVERNHRANFDLWHEEDKARDPRSSDAEIARVKRAIDRLNQHRNDLVEEIDRTLLHGLPPPPTDAVLHSETPGMMIDRMSILALKIFHTREQAEREGVTEAHRLRNVDRLQVLEEQRGDLAGCLKRLWDDVIEGSRRFKMYRQMKMYNDPELNPAIYGARGQGAGAQGQGRGRQGQGEGVQARAGDGLPGRKRD